MRRYSRKQKRQIKTRKTRFSQIKRVYKGGANIPTFHILIATGGKSQLKEMLNSLKNELLEGDAITIIFDGPDALTKSTFTDDWISGFKCPIKKIEESVVLGFWGHAARNKHQGQLTPRTTYIMNADDDDTYIAGSFKSLRSKCTDPNTLYIAKMTYVSNRALNIPRQNKDIVFGDISTQNGIIPFDMAAKGVWKPRYGGDFDYYSDLNKLNPPIIFLDDIIYLKADSASLQSGGSYDNILKYEDPSAKIRVYMYANEMKPPLNALLSSLKRHKYSYEVIGFGEPWTTFRNRLKKYLDATRRYIDELHHTNLDKVVIFCDAFDTLCIKDSDKVLESFKQRPRKLKALYAAETHCYGNCNVNILKWFDTHNLLGGSKTIKASLKYTNKFQVASEMPVFLNAGFVIGEVSKLQYIFNKILKTTYHIDKDKDERFKEFYMLNHKVLYKNIDFASPSDIPPNMYKDDDQIITGLCAEDNPNEFDMDIENSIVRCKILKRNKLDDENGIDGPGFLHFAGDKSGVNLLDLFSRYT